jgi:spore coat protein CotH
MRRMLLLLLACAGNDGTDAPADDSGALTDSGPEVIEGDADTDTDTDADTDTDTGDALEAAQYAALYDPAVLQDVYLTVSAANQDILRADGTEYVPATFEHDGYAYVDVGVRVKGSSTLRGWDAKPSLKIKLNEYVEDQRYGGVEVVTLNNMADDASQSHEVLGYNLLNAAGRLASKASFARVFVRASDADEWTYYGLYANVEEVDERFLKHRDMDLAGSLWEGNDGADFSSDGINNGFELVWGDEDRSDLDDVRSAIYGDGDFYAATDAVVNMEQFTSFWAWRIALGDADGYPYVLNDFYVYDDPADGRFVFIPWGIDESWNVYMTWNAVESAFPVKCLRDATCSAQLSTATAAALTTYEGSAVPTLTQRAFDLTEEAVSEDTRREWAIADVNAARAQLLVDTETWPATVRQQMGL